MARPDLKAGMSGPYRERQETVAKVRGRIWVVVSEAVAVCGFETVPYTGWVWVGIRRSLQSYCNGVFFSPRGPPAAP